MADGAEPIAIGTPEERHELETTASLLTLADPDGVDAYELREELDSLGDRPGKVLRLALARADEATLKSSGQAAD